jgi:cytochrome P450
MTSIPSPKNIPILGHLPYLTKGRGGCFIDSLNRLHKELGPIYRLDIMGRPWIICADPKLMKKALIENVSFFPKGATLEAAHSLDIGKLGLTETEGLEWQYQHKLLGPFFSQKSIHSTYLQVHEVMDKALNYLERFPEIDILDFCNKVSFTFITKMSAAYESKCLNDLSVSDPLFSYQKVVVDQFLKRVKYGKYFRYLPTPTNLKYEKVVKEYRQFFRDLIETFKRDHSDRDDVILYHLINGQYGERKLTELEIIDQIYTVIGAGYESTGAVLHWFLYELAKKPHYIEKLREEIKAVGDQWDHENILKCEFLQICLQEILRLHPAFPMIGREVGQEISIHDFNFPRGAFVFFTTGMMLTDSFWGQDSLEFRPERFLEPKVQAEYKEHFFPFGLGPRKCIGEKMARTELMIMLMRILSKFDLELIPNLEIIPIQVLSNVSKHGIKMRFKKRLAIDQNI